MFTVIPKQAILSQLHEALGDKLADIVMIFPELQQKVEEGILWAIFSKESIYEVPEEKHRRHDSFAYLSYDVIELAKQELVKVGEVQAEFFFPEVDKAFKEKDINVYLDYEDCDVKVESLEKSVKTINKDAKVVIAATLPDSGIVFESIIQGNLFDDANRWLLEYMDMYDAWKHDAMSKLYDYLWQIGGHGRWIQSDYNETYLAQANIDIGDAGSVFFEVRDKEVKGYVDMF